MLFTAEEERVRARQSFPFYQCRELVTSYGTALPPQDGERLRAGFLAAHPGLRGRRLLLFLGRIHEKKGATCWCRPSLPWRAATPRYTVMAGPCDAEMRARLERIAGLCGVGARITRTGMLQGDAKWGAFYAADAFCLPSHRENFGVAVAEALGCGLPVLISDKVNIWRETERSGAGTVAPDSLAGTIDVLQRWLGTDAARRRAMGANARRAFDESFHGAGRGPAARTDRSGNSGRAGRAAHAVQPVVANRQWRGQRERLRRMTVRRWPPSHVRARPICRRSGLPPPLPDRLAGTPPYTVRA